MHHEVRQFVATAFDEGTVPLWYANGAVLEIGAVNINGTIRDLFPTTRRYVGIDQVLGPCVDIVTTAELFVAGSLFDLVLCCEVLEHAKRPQAIVDCAYRSLRIGGMLILTCAGWQRQIHGQWGALGITDTEPYNQLTLDQVVDLFGERWRVWRSGEITAPQHDIQLVVERVI